MKPILILPCSETKAPVGSAQAFDLYRGAYMQMVRQFPKPDILAQTHMLFLSAKYGLIHAEQVIDWYEQRMNADIVANWRRNADMQTQAKQLLISVNAFEPGAEIHLLLSKTYRKGFDALCKLPSHANIYRFPTGGGIGIQRQHITRTLEDLLGVSA